MLSSSPLGRRRHFSSGNIPTTAITSAVIPAHNGVVWGVPLDTLVTQNKSIHHIPFIVQKIVEYVEKHGMLSCYHGTSDHVMLLGLCQEGLYRVNGNAKVIEKLKASFDKS